MAHMVPPGIYNPQGTSPGEVEIFNRLKDDPKTKDWTVLHSLDIATHRKQTVGELDFVVIVPEKGVLCLEVKACRTLRREGGAWYYGVKDRPDYRGPFKQAAEGMYSIRDRLFDRWPDLARTVFWSAVIFPYVSFDETSGEWHPWQVIDNKLFRSRSLGQLLGSILDHARAFLSTRPAATWFDPHRADPTLAQCQIIANTLRPDFEFFESPKSRSSRLQEELKFYTTEQFGALDAMEANPRVAFFGPAGTGKTLLAVEAARRSSAAGHRVLFLCYNRLLRKRLEEVSELPSTVVLTTLHSHMLAIAGLAGPSQAEKFWEDELPSSATDKLLEDERGTHVFDEIIIDEAQDILRDSYLDFLDLSLRGGLATGRWRMFGDFEKQAIYQTANRSITEVLEARANGAPIFSLRANCRNTPRVAELVHLLGGLHPKYSRVLRPDDGVQPALRFYADREEQQQLLSTVLQQLYSEKFAGSDIVILSPRSGKESAAASLQLNFWRERLKPFEYRGGTGIGYCSIQAFKGMEAPVIVVTDVEQLNEIEAGALFYIAVTRALSRLVILMHNRVKQHITHLLASPQPNNTLRSI